MHKSAKRVFAFCLTVCFILTQAVMTVGAAAQTIKNDRLFGSDRYKTAVAISQKGWKTSQYAILARGDDFADALCAGPLAKKYGAPILLTQPDRLNADVLAELKRLGVKNVFIVGGTGAVSSNVEDALKSAGIIKAERIYGADRYETSVKIAEKLGKFDKIALATGSDFPDALSISAVAAKLGMPILLTGKDSMPGKVKQYIDSKQISKTYVIGGTAVINDSIKNLAPNAVRLGGKDRYETNVLVMKEFAEVLKFSDIYLAIGEGPNGNEFADALSGAVLAAQTSSPVVLVGKKLPDVTADFIKTKISVASRATALGGEAVVPSTLLNIIASYVEQVKVSANYNEAGTYGPSSGVETVSGNVVISASGVTLQNTVIEGDLLVTEDVGQGEFLLKNVTVKGLATVRGGGPNSGEFEDCDIPTLEVDVPEGWSVRIVVRGDTRIAQLIMNSDGIAEDSGVTGAGIQEMVIPQGASVTIRGNVDTVSLEAPGVDLNIESGSINNLNVTGSASDANIDIAGGAAVTNLNADAPVEIEGQGSIGTANINSDDVVIQQQPGATNVGNGISAVIGGNTVTGRDEGNTQQGGSSPSPGGTPSSVLVSAITVTGAGNATTVVVDETLQMSASVTPANAANSSVTWSVTPGTGTATINASGLLTGTGAGTVNVKATAADGSGVQGTLEITVEQDTPVLSEFNWDISSAKALSNQPLYMSILRVTSNNPGEINYYQLFIKSGDIPIGPKTSIGSDLYMLSILLDTNNPLSDLQVKLYRNQNDNNPLVKNLSGDLSNGEGSGILK